MDLDVSKGRRTLISERLQAGRQQRRKQKRSLSNNVQTRTFRAPEVIMLEKTYDKSVDTWSIGCILAEMLLRFSNQKVSSHIPSNPYILLAGNTCLPISPGSEDTFEDA